MGNVYLVQKGGLVLLDQRLLRAERTGREAGKGGFAPAASGHMAVTSSLVPLAGAL